MKFSLAAFSFSDAWKRNRPFILLISCLLLIHSLLKIVFYYYNRDVLFSGDEAMNVMQLIKWSLFNDLLVVLVINAPLVLLLQFCGLLRIKRTAIALTLAFLLINLAAILLNIVDIFYYRFRFQRASADLLYVMDHPLRQVFHFNAAIIILFVLLVAALTWSTWMLHKKLLASFENGTSHALISVIIVTGFLGAMAFRDSFSRILLPAYPLLELRNDRLPLVQNSAHTFAYSLFRGGSEVVTRSYFAAPVCDSLFPVKKPLHILPSATRKNVVLFIMESVPYDFFNSNSRFKVRMPFFDSLTQRSTCFNNAFCFLHESNKGITAILAGLPTLTDIPLYHSSYVNMPFTPIGSMLRQQGYHSFFCIGDAYDNFGFAKCMKWLGIDRYYCEEDIPGYKSMPVHPMGLQDEAVLPFFFSKINENSQPFFAAHFNISTHYPYDLPAGYKQEHPRDYTEPMKAMQYYDHCLQQFFEQAKRESWFSNTIFLFCSDHWMFPEGVKGKYDPVAGYRIPIILFDPGSNKKEVNNQVVSQFDIMGTILAAAGCKDSIISYGGNLLDSASLKGFAFSKAGSSLYQVTDSNHVLGFNLVSDQVEYLFNYKTDSRLKDNLRENKNASAIRDALLKELKLFIQKTAAHYQSRSVQ